MATIETTPPEQAHDSGESPRTTIDPAREVLNQAPPLQPVNLFEVDLALNEALIREGGGWGVERARETGAVSGSIETREHSHRAERNEPILRPYDRYGNRVDEVELDPSWHHLLRGAIEREIHSLPWRTENPGGHTVRAALFMLYGNGNDGVMCPVSMTTAAVKALRDSAPQLAAEWEPRLTEPDYDTGALAGMAMTERQGGSDVRANITTAHPVGDDRYEIYGHKWFCSYPPCDVFLVLAQAPGGLSCFLIERGPGMEFQRLKDKLGTRSLPSSEVEFHGIEGRLVGEEGRGVPAIIKMVNHTRLDCLLGGTTGLRRGTLEAIHHARHRSAFGKLLVDQPAMRNVLADLAVESEAATVSAMRVARSYDEDDAEAAAFRRFATAVMKYWVCKRAPGHAAEALECLGGNGFIEDSGLPLLYRDAPLGSIWEGSGNVAALDVLRAMVKEPDGLPAFMAECELAAGADARLDAHLARAKERAAAAFADEDPQFQARRVVEDLALGLQGSLLLRHAPPEVADAFCATRLAGEGGRVYGTLPAGTDAGAIIERAYPGLNVADVEYESGERIALLTLNRPERGNGLTPELLSELGECVERADLDPNVHVLLLAGNGKGFCGGYDLVWSAEGRLPNHDPTEPWDPMIDYAGMSRNVRTFMTLFNCSKPVICKVHGFCVAGGTDLALCSDLLVIAADAKIGYPPARVWGSPTTSMWSYRLGAQRAKRLLFTGDTLSGAQALEWGLAIEAPPADELDEQAEALAGRIANVPINQLQMMKLLVNQTLYSQGLHATQLIGTVFDGITRHTKEGYAFAARAAEAGWREAVRERDAPFAEEQPR